MNSTDFYLIVGGGPAGLTAALELSHRNHHVILFEKSTHLSGKVWDYCCKADAQCQRCGVCHVHRLVNEVNEHPGIKVQFESNVTRVIRKSGQFEVTYSLKNESIHEFKTSYLILAAGFSFYQAERLTRYGYGNIPDVILSSELERMLHSGPELRRISDGLIPKSIAFIQCVGSRTPRDSAAYCSQTCCSFSLRMASKLTYLDSQLSVTIFYSDFQSITPDTDRQLASLGSRIRLVQSIPGEIIKTDDGGLEVTSESLSGILETHRFDLIVLSIGFRPLASLRDITEPLNLELNPHGFVQTPPLSASLGIVGTMLAPMNLTQTIAQTSAAVSHMLRLREDEI